MSVLTLNLANFDDHPDWEQRRSLILEALQTLQPDIVAFQENRFDASKSSLDMASQIAQLAHYQCQIAIAQYYDPSTYLPVTWVTTVWEGLALLWKPNRLTLESSEIWFSSSSITDPNQRIAFAGKFVTSGYTFSIVNLHLSTDVERSLEFLDFILKTTSKQGKVICLGDFNLVPTQFSLHSTGFSDAWVKLHGKDNTGYTFPSSDPKKRIDYALMSHKTRVSNIERVLQVPKNGIFASDHLGLFLKTHF